MADPDADFLESYCERLSAEGFTVMATSNGVECVTKLRSHAPDMLVLDPSLPWGGGDGVLARMAEETDLPRVPVLLLSTSSELDKMSIQSGSPFSSPMHDLRKLSLSAATSIIEFQSKPIDPHQLAQRIRRFLASGPVC